MVIEDVLLSLSLLTETELWFCSLFSLTFVEGYGAAE